jgi:hypothetical protein
LPSLRQHRQFPNPGIAGQQQNGRPGLRRRLKRVRRHHDLMTWQPVRYHATKQQEGNHRNQIGRRDISHIARGTADRQDSERDRHRSDRRPG